MRFLRRYQDPDLFGWKASGPYRDAIITGFRAITTGSHMRALIGRTPITTTIPKAGSSMKATGTTKIMKAMTMTTTMDMTMDMTMTTRESELSKMSGGLKLLPQQILGAPRPDSRTWDSATLNGQRRSHVWYAEDCLEFAEKAPG